MSDTQRMDGKLDALTAQVSTLAEGQRRRDELFDEMTPILREVLGVATGRLQTLESRGYFAFGKALLEVLDHVVTGYDPQDVKELAAAIVSILDAVRAMTDPQMLKLATDLSDAAKQADRLQPVGVLGALRASQDADAQRGMGVILEVLKRLGAGAEKLDRKARLQAQLASRKTRSTGDAQAQRPGQTGAARRPPAAPPPAKSTSRGASAAPARSPLAAAEPLLVDGIAFTPEGFLVDPNRWTRELAVSLAASIGLTLTDAHWALVEFARKEYAETGASPNIRRLTKGAGISTKEIYAMFPKAPGKCTALVAGLPKPVGCI